MKTPFKSIDTQQTYTTILIDIKEFMNNSHESVNLCLINNYGKDMIQFDIRWVINGIEVKAFKSKNHTCWYPKVIVAQGKNIHNDANHLQPILWMGCHPHAMAVSTQHF